MEIYAQSTFQSSCSEVSIHYAEFKCASKWAGHVLSAEGRTFGNVLSSEPGVLSQLHLYVQSSSTEDGRCLSGP